MGQQQLLLIILGVVVVGIAVGVGIIMFQDNAVSQNRDAVAGDMMHLAAKARHYYGRPKSMGGGGHSFVGITMNALVNTSFANNANGIYSIKEGSVTSNSMTFIGVGKVVGNNDSTRVELTIDATGSGSIKIVSGE